MAVTPYNFNFLKLNFYFKLKKVTLMETSIINLFLLDRKGYKIYEVSRKKEIGMRQLSF